MRKMSSGLLTTLEPELILQSLKVGAPYPGAEGTGDIAFAQGATRETVSVPDRQRASVWHSIDPRHSVERCVLVVQYNVFRGPFP